MAMPKSYREIKHCSNCGNMYEIFYHGMCCMLSDVKIPEQHPDSIDSTPQFQWYQNQKVKEWGICDKWVIKK